MYVLVAGITEHNSAHWHVVIPSRLHVMIMEVGPPLATSYSRKDKMIMKIIKCMSILRPLGAYRITVNFPLYGLTIVNIRCWLTLQKASYIVNNGSDKPAMLIQYLYNVLRYISIINFHLKPLMANFIFCILSPISLLFYLICKKWP